MQSMVLSVQETAWLHKLLTQHQTSEQPGTAQQTSSADSQ
jgi:hypothetical protein